MTENLKKYLELQDKWSEAFCNGDEILGEKLMTEADKFEEQFTVEDWQYLIENTLNVTAKIEYTKKMKEKFPESEKEETRKT